MLKGIHPLLSPDLLHAMAAMGHGDSLAIVDANFPAATLARKLLEMRGAGAAAMLEAILSLFPVDTTLAEPAVLPMQVAGDAEADPAPVAEFAVVLTAQGPADVEIGSLERGAFYERARDVFAIVGTGELRPYRNILLIRGVINHCE